MVIYLSIFITKITWIKVTDSLIWKEEWKLTKTKNVAKPALRVGEVVETNVTALRNVIPVEVVPEVGKADGILCQKKGSN